MKARKRCYGNRLTNQTNLRGGGDRGNKNKKIQFSVGKTITCADNICYGSVFLPGPCSSWPLQGLTRCPSVSFTPTLPDPQRHFCLAVVCVEVELGAAALGFHKAAFCSVRPPWLSSLMYQALLTHTHTHTHTLIHTHSRIPRGFLLHCLVYNHILTFHALPFLVSVFVHIFEVFSVVAAIGFPAPTSAGFTQAGAGTASSLLRQEASQPVVTFQKIQLCFHPGGWRELKSLYIVGSAALRVIRNVAVLSELQHQKTLFALRGSSSRSGAPLIWTTLFAASFLSGASSAVLIKTTASVGGGECPL